MPPAGCRGDLLDRGALEALEHLDHERLFGAGARRRLHARLTGGCRLGLPRDTSGLRGLFALTLGRLAFLRRCGRAVSLGGGHWGIHRLASGLGRRCARAARRRALWRVVLGLDADGLEAGAGDPERRWEMSAGGPRLIRQRPW